MQLSKPDPNETQKVKAAIYTRVSTSKQVEGFGLDAQLTICTRKCEDKALQLVKIYSDEGVSGTVNASERPEFSRLMQDAKDRKFEVLIFYAFDRLARDIHVFLDIVKQLKEYGIKIVSCNEDIDTSTNAGEFMLHIYASVSHLELKTIQSRMANGREQKRLESGYIGGKLPYGYYFDNKVLKVNQDEAKIINYIYFLYWINSYSCRRIAEVLNDNKIATPKGGKAWRANSITAILDNRKKYIGGLINENQNQIHWIPILVGNKYKDREIKRNKRKSPVKDKSSEIPNNESTSK